MDQNVWMGTAFNVGILLAFIALVIFFILTLQNALKAVEISNRTMQPAQVWYLFIPIFNIYWVFKIITAISDSAKLQLETYSIYKEGRPTFYLGIAWAISFLLGRIPYIETLFAFVSLILWIVYWVKVSQLKKELLSYQEMYRFREEDSIL